MSSEDFLFFEKYPIFYATFPSGPPNMYHCDISYCMKAISTTSFAYDTVDIIAAFICRRLSSSTDKTHTKSSRVKLSSPRWEITVVCFSYLWATSLCCINLFLSKSAYEKADHPGNRGPKRSKCRS